LRRARTISALIALGTLLALSVLTGSSQAGPKGRFAFGDAKPGRPRLSGAADPKLQSVMREGRRAPSSALPQRSQRHRSDDIQVNGDNKKDAGDQFGSGEGFPQNETTIAINPRDRRNVIGGANDYEFGIDSLSGVYVSFDGGRTWPVSRHIPDVQSVDRDWLASGDPAIAFDSQGTAYFAVINFARTTCDSYVTVSRSVDKGLNWTMPAPAPSAGLEIIPGDGVVAHNGGDEDCQIFHDKEYIGVGPRPAGVPLVPGSDPEHVTPDRVYVTWTKFDFGPAGDTYVESPIVVAYSDDQGRHWSQFQEISGAGPMCEFQSGDQDPPMCDEDQFSTPVVDPRDGTVYVTFENFNRLDPLRNQLLVVKSTDGGQTWAPPVKVADVFDGPAAYPICQGSQVLDNMCARIGSSLGNPDVNRRTGQLYVTWFDNRNGTAEDTNTDVFISTSTDGGATWSEAVNITQASDDDQWHPWLSVTPNGRVVVSYLDRRYADGILIDTSMTVARANLGNRHTRRVSEVSWNANFAFRLGLFIGDYSGLDTTNSVALPFWTDARFGELNVPGNNPPHSQSDVMVDVERLHDDD
jgi:hypothetical protein